MSRLSGTVTLSGSAVSGATVFVIDTDTNSIVATETTDSNGDWEATGLAQSASERYHALVQYDNGSTKYNAESLPFLSTPGIIDPGVSDIAVSSPTPGITATSVIPDSAIAHYDFSDASNTTSITDQSGSGNDLSGSFTSLNATINGNQAGEFDGVDDRLTTSFSAVSQPVTVFIVSEYAGPVEGDTTVQFDSEATDASDAFECQIDNGSNGNVDLIFAGGAVIGGASTTNSALYAGVFDGANSEIRRNGSQQGTGDVGANSLNGITVGSDRNSGRYFEGKIGLVEVHDGLPSNGVQTRESELADQWGITI